MLDIDVLKVEVSYRVDIVLIEGRRCKIEFIGLLSIFIIKEWERGWVEKIVVSDCCEEIKIIWF